MPHFKRQRSLLLASVGLAAGAALLAGILAHHPAARAADNGGGASSGGATAQIEAFWKDWQASRPSAAIRRVATTTDLARNWEPAARVADEFQNRWGRCSGVSQIVHRALGDQMEYDSFYVLYENTPLRVQTLWYGGGRQWHMIALRIDSDTARWMEELSPTPTSITVEQNLNPTNPDQQPQQ